MNPLPAIILAGGVLLAGGPESQVLEAKAEFELKAQFLGRACTFIDWPAGSEVNDPNKPFILGILGGTQKTWEDPMEDSLAQALKAAYSSGQIKGKRVLVKPLRTASEVLACHALYVLPSYKPHVSLLLTLSQKKNILLFGNSPGFADLGIHINLTVLGGKLRFEANEKSFRASGLKIDSLLLRQAAAVKQGEVTHE